MENMFAHVQHSVEPIKRRFRTQSNQSSPMEIIPAPFPY